MLARRRAPTKAHRARPRAGSAAGAGLRLRRGAWPDDPGGARYGARTYVECEGCGRTQTIKPAGEPGGVTVAEARLVGWTKTRTGSRCPLKDCSPGDRG